MGLVVPGKVVMGMGEEEKEAWLQNQANKGVCRNEQ